MALGVQEDVLQLEVPVDDVVPVQEVDGEIQLRRIKPSNIHIQDLFFIDL